jgi:hypothetical protein
VYGVCARSNKEISVNIFDKICAVLAFTLGIVLILLGVIGLFTGCKADFTLPPILGAIPAFVGWGIVKPVVVAWKARRGPEFEAGAGPSHIGPGPLGQC